MILLVLLGVGFAIYQLSPVMSRRLSDSDYFKISSVEVIGVERVVVHPDYHPERVPSHDIAVLILEKPAATAPVGVPRLLTPAACWLPSPSKDRA